MDGRRTTGTARTELSLKSNRKYLSVSDRKKLSMRSPCRAGIVEVVSSTA